MHQFGSAAPPAESGLSKPTPDYSRFGALSPANQTRSRRLATPLGIGAAAAVGCAAIAFANPRDSGAPLCASRAVFGVDCAFCGGIRCTNSLMQGNFVQALDHNVLLAVVLPVAAVLWALWVLRQYFAPQDIPPRLAALSKYKASNWPRWTVISSGLFLIVFGVVRNFTDTSWLIWLHSDLFVA